jgi:hypothetical protein
MRWVSCGSMMPAIAILYIIYYLLFIIYLLYLINYLFLIIYYIVSAAAACLRHFAAARCLP